MKTRMMWIATIVLGMVVTLGGCKGDGHPDHDHSKMSVSPAAPAAR